ncbi:LysR family transcriptional regulator [Streptomyces sp. J2-1]|uniref:LysR substrate-binding domain-containing protein n=1 Tax=Streptomyces corallincola TaxID=2851888 RepID=UPI001C3936EA|nr:LysR substrate-binding domain-containing protein [Streptomyces corallincola]MBV2352840.1 LysR family transcriptional regulator [Streptomyces corallincola]
MTDAQENPPFRLAYVPGATPAKWVRIWNERFPESPLTLLQVAPPEAADLMRAGEADAGLVRLPVDRTFFSAIPLYAETTVVIVPKDHVITAADEVTLADLADEVLFHPLDDVFDWDAPPGEPAFERPATTPDAIELVAAGVGLLIVPQSLARLHHRRDLTYRPVIDAPQSQVALSWPEEATTDRVDDFIGIVRGRTVNSTRGRTPQQGEGTRQEKRPERAGGTARQKQGAPKSGGGKQTGAKQTGGKSSGRPARGRGASAGAAKRGKPRRKS